MHHAILEEMIGCRARLWKFTPSHDRLVVEIRREGCKQRYVSFVLCEKIEVPTLWLVRTPSVKTEDGFLIYVDGVAVIRCMQIGISDQPE